MVFGDSHLGRFNKKLSSNSLPKCRTRMKYFSGVRTKDLEYYVTPTLNEEKPDIVTMHVSSNDIVIFDSCVITQLKMLEKISILVKNVEREGFRK